MKIMQELLYINPCVIVLEFCSLFEILELKL